MAGRRSWHHSQHILSRRRHRYVPDALIDWTGQSYAAAVLTSVLPSVSTVVIRGSTGCTSITGYAYMKRDPERIRDPCSSAAQFWYRRPTASRCKGQKLSNTSLKEDEAGSAAVRSPLCRGQHNLVNRLTSLDHCRRRSVGKCDVSATGG